jgi:hypothetical protein
VLVAIAVTPLLLAPLDASAQIRCRAEVCGNDYDDDCDGEIDEEGLPRYPDADGDGYGVEPADYSSCTPEPGFALRGGDCNDSNASVSPGRTEVCDRIDNDCDSLVDENLPTATYWKDVDGDGYPGKAVSQVYCKQPDATFHKETASTVWDCDDGKAEIRPFRGELCNNIDDNCNREVDEGAKTAYYRDADGDRFPVQGVTQAACSAPTGYLLPRTDGLWDCNDSNGGIAPGATESCNGLDENCVDDEELVCRAAVCSACQPITSCAGVGVECGAIPDGCSGTLNCGGCASGAACVNNRCVQGGVCTRFSQATACAGKCGGTAPDGCGGTYTCPNTCTGYNTCGGGGTPDVCGCVSKTAAVACGNQCGGTAPDGCGGTVTCTTSQCTGYNTCGGSGTANQCGCSPKTAAAACGLQCGGTAPDGCGGTVSCTASVCTGYNTCGGGGTATQCGCSPKTAAAACGNQCGGTAPNGCGGTVTCTTSQCTGYNTCGALAANQCGCKKTDLAVACAGKCGGTVPDGCGGTYTCPNNCTGTNTCGGGGTPNVCGCTPRTKADACGSVGATCGRVSNGCGGSYTCGTCPTGMVCDSFSLQCTF